MNMVFGAPARGRLGYAALFCLFLVIAFPSRALAQNAGVQWTVTNDWGSGFTAEVKITNTSSMPMSSWTLEFDLAGNIVNLWNGAFTKSTTHYTVKNASWNGSLAPGGSATFGFQANYSGGRPNPSNCIFNGGACSFGGDVVPPAAGGLKVNWTIANDWGSGYQADVKINSSGVAVSGWNLQFDLGGIVSNIWNASLATNGSHRTVQNAAWNGGIGAGGSVSFGFTGSYSGTRPDPSNCNINGSACVFEGLTPGGGNPPPPPPVPPSISIVSPVSNATVSGTAVSIVAETGGDGIVSVQFFVDGVSIGQDSSSPYSVSWNTTTVNNGVHSLTAKAIRAASPSHRIRFR